jgi:shikimate dehydrogenase
MRRAAEMMGRPTGATAVAAIIGHPVAHSLSPLIHNAWLEAAGIDGVYVALAPTQNRFPALIEGLRGGAMRGCNVTLPFKAAALAIADRPSVRARRAGAANLLVFDANGTVTADNTDGLGLLAAFAVKAPAFRVDISPVVVLGAGGAARGAAAALISAGAPEVRLVNRTRARAEETAAAFGAQIRVFDWSDVDVALIGAGAVINATTLGMDGGDGPAVPLEALPAGAVVMDMVYRPLTTGLLARARALDLTVVDGLEMLIQQAVPSFEALFGRPPPAGVDVRVLAAAALGDSR